MVIIKKNVNINLFFILAFFIEYQNVRLTSNNSKFNKSKKDREWI